MPGVVGVFNEIDATVDAIGDLKRGDYRDITAYAPTLDHELEHAVGAPESTVRRYTLIGGLLGVTFGYWIAIWTSDYWPLVVGNKAIASWIPYTILGFEVMVLVGALSTVAGMFINSRLPSLVMAVGYDPRFSGGNYGVYVECAPEQNKAVEDTLRRNGAIEVRNAR